MFLSKSVFDNVLSVGPVVAVEVQRHCVNSLRLGQVVSWKHAAAVAEIDVVHQLRDVAPAACSEPRYVRNLIDWCAGAAELSRACPAAVYQSIPDFGSTRLLSAITSRDSDEIAGHPADVGGLNHETFRQLTFVSEVPGVIDRRHEF